MRVQRLWLCLPAVVLWLPRRWAAVVAATVAAGHAFAVSMWCLILFQQQLLALVTVGLGVVGLAVLAWQRGWRGSLEPGTAVAQKGTKGHRE
jgi:hypothetical protein